MVKHHSSVRLIFWCLALIWRGGLMSSGGVWCAVRLYRVCKWWHEGSHVISVSSIDLHTHCCILHECYCLDRARKLINDHAPDHLSHFHLTAMRANGEFLSCRSVSHTLTVRQPLVPACFYCFDFIWASLSPLLVGTCVQVWYLNKRRRSARSVPPPCAPSSQYKSF